jgi:hypothetical protein
MNKLFHGHVRAARACPLVNNKQLQVGSHPFWLHGHLMPYETKKTKG